MLLSVIIIITQNKYGIFKKNDMKGEMIDALNKHLNGNNLTGVEIKKLFSALLAVKDKFEIVCDCSTLNYDQEYQEKSAEIACAVLTKHFVKKMEDIINNDTKVWVMVVVM